MKKMVSRVLAACALLASLAVGAAPTLTYYSGGVATTKSSWTADAEDTAAGWKYDVKGLDTDVLELYGEGASYKLSGSVGSDFSVLVAKSCTVTLDNYSVEDSKSPFVVANGATLMLLIGEGTSTIKGARTLTGGADTGHAGIEVQPGGTVIIDKVEGASDEACILNVTGGKDAAAIGASDTSSCGDIVINGGTINATAGDEAAGIGGSNINSAGDYTIGTITINGGVVTANGRDRGAGIGVGLVQHSCTVTAAGIYINGGTVNASENDGRAAGIGTGEVSQGTVTVNEIVITGGTVTAAASTRANGSVLAPQEAAGAGIGTGIIETGGQATINKIEISGGDVTATGADRGAGIGTGEVYLGHSAATIGEIEISGGHVTANGGAEAAGIGTGVSHGAAGNASAEVTAIEISGGTVEAHKGADATGSDIGLATSSKGNSTGATTMDSVTVTGGSVATGTTMTTPTDGTSLVYSLTVTNLTAGSEVAIAGLGSYGTEDIVVGEDGTINMSVPEGTYVFNVNGRLYEATVTSAGGTADFAADTGMEIDGVDIAYGSGTGWFYDGATLSIETNATLTVSGESRLPVELVLDDGADVTLDDVTIIGQSGIPALTTTENANVTVRLDGDNTLEGRDGAAAVQPAVGATITIVDGAGEGIGELEATGGAGAAGIGAGATNACGNVTIAGGHVWATGGTGAAGIGAGENAGANCGVITISGGTVEAAHGGTAHHLTGQDVGNGGGGTCSGVVVTGGSLVANNSAVDPSPSGIGNETGHAVTIQNNDWTVGQAIVISGLPEGYGTNDIVATENKSVVVWVPDGNYPLEVNGDWYVVSVDGGDGAAVKAQFAEKPSVIGAEDLVYTGSPITGVPTGEGYTITGNVGTDPGHYTATVTPAAGYLWSDHTMAPVQIDWYIAPAIIDSQYGTVTYDDDLDAWVVTVTNDITGPVEIPDTLGSVVFDLNGHDIVGADGTGENPDGGAAVHIVHAENGTGVNVTFVDNSCTDSRIVGGTGADGTAEHPAGGNGGPGILIDDAAEKPIVTIDAGVLVIGGYGGAAFDDSGEDGGNGGAGIQDASGTGTGTPLDSEINNGGIIAGGNGGAGANSSSDAAGNGGNGGAGVDGFVNNNNGEVIGGVAGNGGSSSTGAAGNGGNGGTGVTGNVAKNEGSITGGDAGDGGTGTPAGAAGTPGAASEGTVTPGENGTTAPGMEGSDGREIPAIIDPQYGTVTYDVLNDAWVVTATNDITGPVEISDTLGNVVFDLNGHDIVGADGDGTNPDGGAAVHVVHAENGTGVNVSFVDGSGTGSQIAGGNGADGTSANPAGGNGGPGILIDDNAANPSVTIGADVEVVGGNGGTAFAGSGANGGNGGAGVQDNSGTGGGTTDDSTIENGGTITGGNGGEGGDSASGNGGTGGNGGAGVDGNVDENDGSVTGGNAGNGGDGSPAGDGGNGGAASTGTIGDDNGQPGTSDDGNNGTSGSGTSTVDPNGGATWLDGSLLRMTAIAKDGENMALTFSVPLQAGLDFANWVQLSVANRKLAVVVADSLPAMTNVELAALLNGGTAEGARVIFVGTAACSASTAEFVSSDAAAKTMTIRVPKAAQASGFYCVCVLKD